MLKLLDSKNYIKRSAFIILGIIYFILIIFFGVSGFQNNGKTREVRFLDAQTDYGKYQDGWLINDKRNYEEKGDSEYVEVLSLFTDGDSIGGYTVTVDYQCEENQLVFVRSQAHKRSVIGDQETLNHNARTVSFQYELTKDIDDAEIVFCYSGKGDFKIDGVTVTNNGNPYFRKVLFLVLSLQIIAFFFWSPYIRKEKDTLFILALICLASSLPLLVKGIVLGHDMNFHMMRIEGIAEGLRQGEFPVKIASLWYDGYGYANSIYYGDILLYLPAMLRILGFSLVHAYKLYVFAINILTVILSYYSFNKIFLKKNIALITTAAYVLSTYRFMDIFVRASVGEYSAMAFLPLVMLAIYKIYTDNIDSKRYIYNSIPLAFGMAGVFNTHMLTTEITLVVLFTVVIVLLKKTIRKRTLITFVLSVVLFCGLSLFFIVPFLDYYFNVNVAITEGIANGDGMKIQDLGAYIGQYFAFFQSIFGNNSTEVNERMTLTPGIVLMISFILPLYTKIVKKKILYKKEIFIWCVAAITLFMGTNIFPWEILRKNELLSVLTSIQFPWRYLTISCICLTMVLGFEVAYYEKNNQNALKEGLHYAIVMFLFVQSTFFLSNYIDDGSFIYPYDATGLSHSIMASEYKSSKTNPDEFTCQTADYLR